MKRPVKREPVYSTRSRTGAVDAGELRDVKKERVCREQVNADVENSSGENEQDSVDRRVLRSQYLAVIHEISEGREDISSLDSDKFNTIFSEVEKLHDLVQKPREQVVDAEALQGIANTLVTSIKSQSSEGVKPSDFVTCLLREFGQSNGGLSSQSNSERNVNWKDIGLFVSPVLMKSCGCCTMIGPMNTQLKQRKPATRRTTRPTQSEKARPEELDDDGAEERTDTDKNMSMMFDILRRKKRVKLECLILNRRSFAQTVENLFALSFLVKDGRAEVTVDESGSHFASPRNAPTANSVMSRDVVYSHFVFRFDFKDWKLMWNVVPVGEELMPHRNCSNSAGNSQVETAVHDSQGELPTTPIRKLSRNRGLVVQDESVVEESPDNVIDADKGVALVNKRRRRMI